MNKPFKRFLPETKEILADAQKTANDSNQSLKSKHLIYSLVNLSNSVAYDILTSFGIDLDKLQLSLSIKKRKKESKKISKEAKQIIKDSIKLAKEHNHKIIAPEHLLEAICNKPKSSGFKLLKELDIDPKKIKEEIESIFDQADLMNKQKSIPMELPDDIPMPDQIGTGLMMPGKQKKKKKLLPTFTTNLVKMANEDKLDPLIGRDKEVKRVIKILNRRTKNNPVLVGEAGVGKTAIVEGIATRIAEEKVPEKLKSKKILNLDLSLILAGTKYRGQFEQRLKKIVKEIKADPDIILFLDEIHTIAGAGAAEGSIDAANIIKPALAKGDLRLIGATTLDEYRQSIEKDSALERRLQMVKVDEPTTDETIKILKGIRDNYEKHHNVEITDPAVKEAVNLSQRYITDRKLPDKAVDLIDEASSAKNLSAIPKKETKEINKTKKEIKKRVKEKEEAVVKQDYEKAADKREEELKLKSKLMDLEKKSKETKGPKQKIEEEDIAQVVSEWTDIPVTNLVKKEKKKYQDLEKKIKEKIIGQDKVVQKVSQAIKRSRTGISESGRPIGSFIFLGPTGVGKTETVKVLAKTLFENEDALIRVDMSEFMEKHNVSKMVGAPPGYVGYDEGGKLTEQVRRNPYSVVLLDEIEKSHRDVQNILLQILEDGFVTDGQGRKVDFSNTVIIMTSNIGTKALNKQAAVGFQDTGKGEQEKQKKKYRQMKKQVLKKLKDQFRPEFLNRVDNTIVFRPLKPTDIKKIVKIKIEELKERLKEQKDLKLKITKAATKYVAEKGFDPDLGARPIRRVISQKIEDQISEKILEGELKEGQTVKVNKKRGSGLQIKTG